MSSSNSSSSSCSSNSPQKISASSRYHQETRSGTTKGNPSGKITEQNENVRPFREIGKDGEYLSPGRAETSANAGAQSRNRFPPSIKTPDDDSFRPRQKVPPVGFARSSPNLKALNTLAGVEQARLLEDYLSGNMARRNGSYVDPLYRQLNPTPGGTRNKPVWSLNQPLPHVLDKTLAEKMIQKNMDARSHASSKLGSRDASRSGSMTSINDWKKFLRRAASNMKLTDIEAQLPNAGNGADAMSSKPKKLEHIQKPSESQIEFAQEDRTKPHHAVSFSLGDESYPPSVADEEPQSFSNTHNKDERKSKDADLLKGTLEKEAKITSKLDGDSSIGDIEDESPDELKFTNFWAKIRYRMREPFAEFLGTLVLVIFGVGGNLQATVTKGSGGSYESLSFAWGFGCMLGVYVAGGISGGHINPAVTISMAIFRKFPWKKVPVYIVAQIIGAFFGGAMAYGYFWSSITEFEGGPHIRTTATGACLFTNPKTYVTWRNAFFDEFIGASVLVGCLMALLDDSNAPPANGMTALIVGLLVAAIGMALGYQTSFTINPARDLGPRIFASMIGYGPHAFHLTHWWWTWGAWGGPIAGGIAGALVYDLFIFTGCESPINYPDNGYIEHRVDKLLHAEFLKNNNVESVEVDLDNNSKSNSSKKSSPT